jgi:hypothetical protein
MLHRKSVFGVEYCGVCIAIHFDDKIWHNKKLFFEKKWLQFTNRGLVIIL